MHTKTLTKCHSSFICSSKKLLIVKLFINIRMDKQFVAYSCNGTPLSFKKEQAPYTCNNIDESHKYILSKRSQMISLT